MVICSGVISEMKKIKKYLKGKFNQVRVVNKALLILLTISVISILVMDLYLKKIPAPFEILYVLGVLYYNSCLSYIASFIFYIITIHIPTERKKISVYRYMNNKVNYMLDLQLDLLNAIVNGPVLCSNANSERLNILKEEELKSACQSKNPNDPVLFVSTIGVMRFENWFQFIDFLSNKASGVIKDLLIFEDYLSTELIMTLTNIEDIFSHRINRTEGNTLANTDMGSYSNSIWNLHKESKHLIKTFREDNQQIDNYYHKMFNKRNKVLED